MAGKSANDEVDAAAGGLMEARHAVLKLIARGYKGAAANDLKSALDQILKAEVAMATAYASLHAATRSSWLASRTGDAVGPRYKRKTSRKR